MRKITFIIALCWLAGAAAAASLQTTASYIYSADYNQARLGAAVPVGLNLQIGLEGKYVEDKLSAQQGGLADPVYSVYMPMLLDLDLAQLAFTPFYYFKNKSDNPAWQDAYAYGMTAKLTMHLVQDDVEEKYTQGYIQLGYARQNGSTFDNTAWQNEDFDQLAFTLGLQQNYYDAFLFQAAATAYEYPDGISRVTAFHGVLDQKDLAFAQSFDVSRALGKYTLSGRLTRLWAEQRSSLYLGYHYAEAHTAVPEHSILVGNTFYVTPQAGVDIAFNHLRDNHNHNKRDLIYVQLHINF